MTADMSIIGLLLGASVPVQIVMLLLIGASVVSWSIIFTKRRLIRRTTESSDEFEAAFWSGGDLNTLYQSATRAKSGRIGMSRIFDQPRLPPGSESRCVYNAGTGKTYRRCGRRGTDRI